MASLHPRAARDPLLEPGSRSYALHGDREQGKRTA